MAIDPELMKILACPACKSRVFEADAYIFCTNADCRRRYAVTDGIPVMLIEEAVVLASEDWSAAMRNSPDAL